MGDWVEVAYEYAPGTCSDGGVAFIMSINKDDSGRATCTVSYILDKRIERFVDQSRITVTIPWPPGPWPPGILTRSLYVNYACKVCHKLCTFGGHKN